MRDSSLTQVKSQEPESCCHDVGITDTEVFVGAEQDIVIIAVRTIELFGAKLVGRVLKPGQ